MESIRRAGCANLLIIDGFSDDGTQTILDDMQEAYLEGRRDGLANDCQLGIDLSKTELCFFVDADHIVPPNFFESMYSNFLISKVDFVQSKLRIHEPSSLMNLGEDAYYRYIHNVHRDPKMIGTSPSLFRKTHLQTGGKWQFVSSHSKSTGDTSWARRAHVGGARFAIVDPEVAQMHEASVFSYVRKFKWYGYGDAEFIRENPKRRLGMLFHLSIRYPIFYGFLMIKKANFPGFVFVAIQGLVRFVSCLIKLAQIRSIKISRL